MVEAAYEEYDEYYNRKLTIMDHLLTGLVVYDEMGKVMFRLTTDMDLKVEDGVLKIFTFEDK